MKNRQIAGIFSDIADLLEIKGDNPFRIRAYRRAAQEIEGLADDISAMTEEMLTGLPGIGKDLAGKIREFLITGKVNAYEKLKAEIPESLITLLTVPGVGPKTARHLHDSLKVRNIADLERLAKGHKLSGLPGIKSKTEENILKGIELLRRVRERQPLARVLPIANEIVQQLKKASPLREISLAGSIRRWKDTIRDIDILATSAEPLRVMKVFVSLPQVHEVLMHGPAKSSILTKEGIQVDLRVVEEESYGAARVYFTGSKAHNIRLREMAMRAGMKINEYGIFRESGNKKLGGRDEEDVYRLLGLPYIEPELREDTGEIEAAIEGNLPELIGLKDIRGDLHVHSRMSDGSNTIEELAAAAKKRGYSYIAITDHTEGLGVAGGLSAQKILEEAEEIRSINRGLDGFTLLSGAEVNIRSDNTLDMPDGVLKKLDIVVASIHSGFRQERERLTNRLISAIKNPYVSVIAHPTGRLLGERDAYDIDIQKVFDVLRKTGKALELNAYPLRLDINETYAKKARDMGIPVVISTDAHSTGHFDYMLYGVATGRRGWLCADDVRNTLNTPDLLKWLKSLRSVM